MSIQIVMMLSPRTASVSLERESEDGSGAVRLKKRLRWGAGTTVPSSG